MRLFSGSLPAMLFFNCSRSKFEAIVVNVCLFYSLQNFPLNSFFAFVVKHSLTSQVTFSRLSLFWSDHNCSVAELKAIMR